MPVIPNPNPDIERLTKSKPVRLAWKILGSAFVGLLLVFGSMQVAVALAHEEYTDVDSFDAANVAVVEIHNSAGSVRVSDATEGSDTIDVTAHVSDGLRKTGHSETIDGDRLVLRASCPNFGSTFCDVEYIVRVPSDVQVVVRAVGGVTVRDISAAVDVETESSVEVAGLSGPTRVRAVDGSVTATDLRADEVDASSVDGNVFVDFDSSPQSVRAETVDGDVEVVIPDDQESSYRVETNTVDGDNTIDIRYDPAAGRSIVAKTVSGDITVRYS